MAKIALVTARAARGLDDDLPPLQHALHKAGADIAVVDWDDANVDWSRFDVALLRSTWDYTERVDEFLDWAQRAAVQTRLVNPLGVVRWNTDKHYLHALESAGIATVPSVFIEPDDDAHAGLENFLRRHASAEFVVKPAIGAGSRDAQRYALGQRDAALAHVRRLLADKRSALLQPYLDRVDEHGETALVYFGGEFSHAIRKGPLLKPNEGPTRALFAAEHITARAPDAAELHLAEQTLAAIPFAKPLTYARVDLIHNEQHAPCVLELELTEPSLFFAHSAGSAERFARAVLVGLA
jgi:glutathione synthase/RimK-type ligase-like ATP-grasp enzyme